MPFGTSLYLNSFNRMIMIRAIIATSIQNTQRSALTKPEGFSFCGFCVTYLFSVS